MRMKTLLMHYRLVYCKEKWNEWRLVVGFLTSAEVEMSRSEKDWEESPAAEECAGEDLGCHWWTEGRSSVIKDWQRSSYLRWRGGAMACQRVSLRSDEPYWTFYEKKIKWTIMKLKGFFLEKFEGRKFRVFYQSWVTCSTNMLMLTFFKNH